LKQKTPNRATIGSYGGPKMGAHDKLAQLNLARELAKWSIATHQEMVDVINDDTACPSIRD
jgi:hypothetical protein